ncbi:MAG: DUF1073 domain-containing protein, partial [Verrucomicrobiota bacterium]
RSPTETTAREMTRKFIRLVSQGKNDNGDKLTALDAAFKRHKIQDICRLAVEHDGFFPLHGGQ